MDTQTIGLCVIDFLLAVVVWLIKDSQRRIEKRIDRYARKNEAEHANFCEALAQHGREYREALAQQLKENREALAQLGAELTALRVAVAELTGATERELLGSLRQSTTGSGQQERKLADGD